MCDRNAKSEYILIKISALVCKCIWERTTKFHEKILLDSRVINLQIPTTKFLGFQYSVAYSRRNSCLLNVFWEPVRRSRNRWWLSVAVSSLEHTDLFFIDQCMEVNGQYYWDVLLHQQLLPAIGDLSGDFFTFQQDNAPAHRARDTVKLVKHHQTSMIQLCGQPTVLTWAQ